MDVTGGLGPAITAAVAQLGPEEQKLFDGLVEQITALEAMTMRDIQAAVAPLLDLVQSALAGGILVTFPGVKPKVETK